MAHFAKVINGLVESVIVAEQSFIDSGAVGDPAQWVQASYNTHGGVHFKPGSTEPSKDQSKALRKNFPSVGFSYDSVRDAFIPVKEYPSWVLDEGTCWWVAPTPYPKDGRLYVWDEAQFAWQPYGADGQTESI